MDDDISEGAQNANLWEFKVWVDISIRLVYFCEKVLKKYTEHKKLSQSFAQGGEWYSCFHFSQKSLVECNEKKLGVKHLVLISQELNIDEVETSLKMVFNLHFLTSCGLYYKTITIVIMTIVSDATIWSVTYGRY